MSSIEFSKHILEKAGIATTPGNYFGELGEGYEIFSRHLSRRYFIGYCKVERAVRELVLKYNAMCSVEDFKRYRDLYGIRSGVR